MAFCFDCHFCYQFFLKYHMPLVSKRHVDGDWVFLSVCCWCLSVKWKFCFGRQLRCGSYHNTFATPSTLTPLVNSSHCGTVEGTKFPNRLIHRACQNDVESPPPLYCHHHYLIPSFLLSTLPSPQAAEVTGHKSLQTWAWGFCAGKAAWWRCLEWGVR